MPTGVYPRTVKVLEALKRRRVPARTKEWSENIGKALRRGEYRTCQCGKGYYCHRYRLETKKHCSLACRKQYGIWIGWNKGKTLPKGSLAKMGAKNPMWGIKKDLIGLPGLHSWVRRRIKHLKPLECEKCGEQKPLDMANKSRTYTRDLTDWIWLCRKCHFHYDQNWKGLEIGWAMKPFPITDAMRKKMSDAHKGQTAWNKGLVGAQKAWNKGLKKEQYPNGYKGYRTSERYRRTKNGGELPQMGGGE